MSDRSNSGEMEPVKSKDSKDFDRDDTYEELKQFVTSGEVGTADGSNVGQTLSIKIEPESSAENDDVELKLEETEDLDRYENYKELKQFVMLGEVMAADGSSVGQTLSIKIEPALIAESDDPKLALEETEDLDRDDDYEELKQFVMLEEFKVDTSDIVKNEPASSIGNDNNVRHKQEDFEEGDDYEDLEAYVKGGGSDCAEIATEGSADNIEPAKSKRSSARDGESSSSGRRDSIRGSPAPAEKEDCQTPSEGPAGSEMAQSHTEAPTIPVESTIEEISSAGPQDSRAETMESSVEAEMMESSAEAEMMESSAEAETIESSVKTEPQRGPSSFANSWPAEVSLQEYSSQGDKDISEDEDFTLVVGEDEEEDIDDDVSGNEEEGDEAVDEVEDGDKDEKGGCDQTAPKSPSLRACSVVLTRLTEKTIKELALKTTDSNFDGRIGKGVLTKKLTPVPNGNTKSKVKSRANDNHSEKVSSASTKAHIAIEAHSSSNDTAKKFRSTATKKEFICEWEGCSYEASTKQHMQMHVDAVHLKLKRFFCDQCNYATYHRHNLEAHVNSRHAAQKPFVCNVCEAGFSTATCLKQHFDVIHMELKPFKCPECQKAFGRKLTLSKHIDIVHIKVKKFKCGECKFSCTMKGNLKQHIASVHKKVKEFKCTECSYSSAQKSKLKRHVVNVHKKEREFKCAKCNFISGLKSSMRDHIYSVHKELKRFKCGECKFSSDRRNTLNNHIHCIHRNVKKFKCADCEFSCTLKSTLSRHIDAVHRKVKGFKCSFCPFQTSFKVCLNRHQLKLHRQGK